jgi:hypothetical protein
VVPARDFGSLRDCAADLRRACAEREGCSPERIVAKVDPVCGRPEVHVPLAVAMLGGAPASCQGLALHHAEGFERPFVEFGAALEKAAQTVRSTTSGHWGA